MSKAEKEKNLSFYPFLSSPFLFSLELLLEVRTFSFGARVTSLSLNSLLLVWYIYIAAPRASRRLALPRGPLRAALMRILYPPPPPPPQPSLFSFLPRRSSLILVPWKLKEDFESSDRGAGRRNRSRKNLSGEGLAPYRRRTALEEKGTQIVFGKSGVRRKTPGLKEE